MRYLVTCRATIQPTVIVEAESYHEAIDKAWTGDVVDEFNPQVSDHAEDAVKINKRYWIATELDSA